jgi:lysophospholipid acyltransferase (LPLAT)-like uncharacterized protein
MSPLLDAYAYAGGAAVWAFVHAWRRAGRIRIHGSPPPEGQSSIACFWHQYFMLYFIGGVVPGTPLVSFYHPKHYLLPWKSLARMEGWTMIPGSSGHGGRDAADQIVSYLHRGYSAFVCPDAPAGPPRVLKKGVLHVAQQAGVPIVPIRFSASPAIHLPSWDGKVFPLPSATIDITYADPIDVSGEDLSASSARLRDALG